MERRNSKVKKNGKRKPEQNADPPVIGDLTKRWCGGPKRHSSHHHIQFYILKSRFGCKGEGDERRQRATFNNIRFINNRRVSPIIILMVDK
jgi:hypothetical protein